MKFYLQKAIILLILIVLCSTSRREIHNRSTKMKMEIFNKINFDKNNSKIFDKNRFTEVSSESTLNDRHRKNDLDVFIMNTIIGLKSSPKAGSQEEEVFPSYADSHSYFGSDWKPGVSWLPQLWNNLSYQPQNTINKTEYGSKYWLSTHGVQSDYLQFNFEEPTKLNVMTIKWRMAPTTFKVEFKVRDDGPYIPMTETFYKYRKIELNGEPGSIAKVLSQDSLTFQKPIFAKSVKISMWDPLKSSKFGIDKVLFYKAKDIIMLTNKSYNKCKNYCMYVNTNVIREGTRVCAIDCLSGMSTADNRELWTLNANNKLSYFNNGQYCLGTDMQTKQIILKNCEENEFILNFKADDTISFRGYENECIVMDTSKDMSDNFLGADTDLVATSEYDDEVYKKANILNNVGDGFWMTVPGQKKQTLIMNFGKISEDEWEIKKVDQIVINWFYAAKKYRIFSWYPGSAWVLIGLKNQNTTKDNSFNFSGIKSSAIMIQMDDAQKYPELSNQVVYGIKYVYIGSKSYKMISRDCSNVGATSKIWDLEKQFETNVENSTPFQKEYLKYTTKMSLMINIFKKSQAITRDIKQKSQLSSSLLKSMQDLYKIMDDSRKFYNNFGVTKLVSKANTQYFNFLKLFQEHDKLNKKDSSGQMGGSPQNPANNCLRLKQLYVKAHSGFYFIKPDCSAVPYKVWCDFSLHKTSVDILVWSGNRGANADLSDWNMESAQDVRYQCAKIGLKPLHILNDKVLLRSRQMIEYLGYDLHSTFVVPIGYDYECAKGNCSKKYRSFDKSDSPVVNSFFKDDKNDKDTGIMAGLGYGKLDSLFKFNSKEKMITAIICSSNKYEINSSTDAIFLDCNETLNDIQDKVPQGQERLIECTNACNITTFPVYGDKGKYDGKSSICKAAIHSGSLNYLGGKVKIHTNGLNQDQKNSSDTNGIVSHKNPSVDSMSFSFGKYVPNCPINEYLSIAEKLNYIPFDTSFMELKSHTSIQTKNINLSELAGIDPQDLKNAGFEYINGKPVSQEMLRFAQNNNDDFKMTDKQKKMMEDESKGPQIDNVSNKALQTLKDVASKSNPSMNEGLLKKLKENSGAALSDAAQNLDLMKQSMGANIANQARDLNASQERESAEAQKPANSYDNSSGNNLADTAAAQALAKKKAYAAAGGDPTIIEQLPPTPDPSKNCIPTTSNGYTTVDNIFKNNFSQKFESGNSTIDQVMKVITAVTHSNSFATQGETSIENLKKKLQETQDVGKNTFETLYEVSSLAESRKNTVISIYDKWVKALNEITQYRTFEGNYAGTLADQYNIINVKPFDEYKVGKWNYQRKGIKGKTQAVGIVASYVPIVGIAGTFILNKNRLMYDFTFATDLLISANSGKCGIVFRYQDRYTYYALVIDMDSKTKTVVIVNKGVSSTLYEAQDGGILTNSWHKVTINSSSSQFLIDFKSKEGGAKISEIRFSDGTLASGGVGFFSGSANGLFFDKNSLESKACWTPWIPRKKLQVVTSSTQYYSEGFTGKLTDKYEITDPEGEVNGPSKWVFYESDSPYFADSMRQNSKIRDESEEKNGTKAILKNYTIMNGNFKTGFYPKEGDGIISIFFRYHKAKSADVKGESLSYYTFELRNMDNGNQKEFVLKKFNIDKSEVLKTVKSDFGYSIGRKHLVIISVNKGKIIIKLSVNDSPFKAVLKHTDKDFIRYGLVGVGTYGTPAWFLGLTLYPFDSDITASEISDYTKSPVDLPFFPPLPKFNMDGGQVTKTKKEGKDDNNSDNGKDDNTNITTPTNPSNPSGPEKKQCPQKGKNPPKAPSVTCLINNTNEKRITYCKDFMPFINQSVCQVRLFFLIFLTFLFYIFIYYNNYNKS